MRNMMLRVFLKFTCDHAGMQGIRAAFRSGTLPAGVVALLRKAGFCFDTRLAAAVLAARERLQAERMRADHDAQTWNSRFEQLRQYWLQYGHAHPRVGQVSLSCPSGISRCPTSALFLFSSPSSFALVSCFHFHLHGCQCSQSRMRKRSLAPVWSSRGNAFVNTLLRAHGRTEEVRKLQ